MTQAKTAKALAAAAVAATAGMAASPASAATHRPAPASSNPLHGFVPRSGPATATAAAAAARSMARPDTSGRCAVNSGTQVADLCAAIYGQYSSVTKMSAAACTWSWAPGVWMHYEIQSPKGHYWNSRSWYRSHGNCFPSYYGPTGKKLNPGYWKFRTWENLGGGHFVQAESVRIGVVGR